MALLMATTPVTAVSTGSCALLSMAGNESEVTTDSVGMIAIGGGPDQRVGVSPGESFELALGKVYKFLVTTTAGLGAVAELVALLIIGTVALIRRRK